MPIAANFAEAKAFVLAAVDFRFAETLRFSPTKGGETDPNRQQREITGVLRVGEGKDTNAGGGRSESWRSRILAGKGELHIDRAVNQDVEYRSGDRIRAIGRAGQPVFEILGIDSRSHTRLVLQLGEVN